MEAARLRAWAHVVSPYPRSRVLSTAPPPASRRFPGQTSGGSWKWTASKLN